MTAYCGTFDIGTRNWIGPAVSEEAVLLEGQLKESFEHYLEPRLQFLLPEIREAATEQVSPKVDESTIYAAELFANCLPRLGPLPEISVDPDGEISFDWIAPSGNTMFSVSVNNRNRLAYAGWFGEKSRIHRIEQLVEACPPEILRGIERATRTEEQPIR